LAASRRRVGASVLDQSAFPSQAPNVGSYPADSTPLGGSVMKLSRTVAYAVRATLQLAQANSGAPVPCSRLASEGRMPERFLLQILRNLVTHGILHSTRGVDGGYSLERKPEEISLLDLIEAIDGPLIAMLPDDPEEGERATSEIRLREALEYVNTSVRRQLQAVRISDLLSSQPLAKLA
jgi:Rrf2 family protein